MRIESSWTWSVDLIHNSINAFQTHNLYSKSQFEIGHLPVHKDSWVDLIYLLVFCSVCPISNSNSLIPMNAFRFLVQYDSVQLAQFMSSSTLVSTKQVTITIQKNQKKKERTVTMTFQLKMIPCAQYNSLASPQWHRFCSRAFPLDIILFHTLFI